MDRTLASVFIALVATTTLLASAAVVVFGPDSSLARIPGIFEHQRSVWELYAMPAFLMIIGIIGTTGLRSSRVVYAPFDELSPDAQKGLAEHLRAERRLLIGVGILVALVQLLVILKTAGFSAPFDLSARLIIFAMGLLLAAAGNVIPKIPFFDRWWQMDRATYTHVIRFSGWAISVAGVLICAVSVFAPADKLQLSLRLVGMSMIGLFVVNALFQVFKTAVRR